MPLGGRQQRLRAAAAARERGRSGRADHRRALAGSAAAECDQERSAPASRLRSLLESEQAGREEARRQRRAADSRPRLCAEGCAGRARSHRFESLLHEGREALGAGEADVAASPREALALWRGPPLAEFASDSFANVDIARLSELWLSAVEERIEADLATGRSGELVAELESLVAAHPLRERLRGQLMLALYRGGRQAEALQVYQDTRRLLVDELGIEPSQALQRLEQAILRQEESLEPRARAALTVSDRCRVA